MRREPPGLRKFADKGLEADDERQLHDLCTSTNWSWPLPALPPNHPALQQLGLTPRESEVLHWVRESKTNKDIGTILRSSPRTVGKHLERVFAKLGVETRTAAAARAHGSS